MRLKEISNIFSGYFAKPTGNGEIIYLQANYFDETGRITNLIYPSLLMDNKVEPHILMPGDILYAAKGTKNFAVQYNQSMGKCVASPTFLIIRITERYRIQLRPEFLLWLLNLPRNSRYLKANASGTNLPSISKKVLEELEVNVPSIQTQEKIIMADLLMKLEKANNIRLAELREQQIQQRLTNLIYN